MGLLERETGLKWLVRKSYYNLATGLFLYSSHEAKLLRDLGYTKRLTVVGNSNYSAADLQKYSGAQDADVGNGICYIGRISPDKGLDEFVRFARINPDRKVLLLGPVVGDTKKYEFDCENLVFLPAEYDVAMLRALTNELLFFSNVFSSWTIVVYSYVAWKEGCD